MRAAHPDRPARPLLLVGWDGATPELVGPWMADGTLPNLAALSRRGGWAPLRSTLHPLSPAAWASAFTGLNPGRHGIYDFGHRAPDTYRVDPTDGSHRRGAALWEIAAEAGLRSVVVGVPMSHPSVEVPGVMFVPGLGAASLEDATWPRSLAGQITAQAPGYAIDINAYEHADPAEFLDAVGRMVEDRAAVAVSLIERDRPDLAFVVFVATDRVQHGFWRQSLLPDSPAERGSWRFAHAVRDCYRQLDDALGRLVQAAGEDATVLVVSDHGFGELEGDLYLNGVLEQMGLLSVDRGPVRSPLGALLERVLGRLPGGLRRAAPGRDEASPVFGDIRWHATKAYARGLFGQIWLNQRGREPHGIVEPGPEADGLLTTITDRLLALREPDGRSRLIQAVFRGADLYHGPHAQHAPDLVVVPADYRWMTRSGREFGPPGVVTAEPAVRHSGNHRMNGVLVGGGPGIQQGASPELLRLLDLSPTALALLGIEVPRSLDGVPMTELLSCDVGWTDDVPVQPGAAEPGDRDVLQAQLRGLGYLA